jgi:ubiquinol oxidase
MTLRKPSIFFRALVLGAQGVFYNLFCEHLMRCMNSALPNILSVLSYIVSPRTCHRFVGYLEEEAVVT